MNSEDKKIETWKMKKLIKTLENFKGNGTSMISLILSPKDQISRAIKMLADEYGTASNIKSRVNRQSVLDAIISTQQRLKLFTRVPDNGLALYCGTVITDEGKEKKITIDIEPLKKINCSLYICDNKFHIDALKVTLEDDTKFGFVIMDGEGALFGIVAGNSREIIQKISIVLPKKHRRGGQSAVRFSRLREEARHNYIRKVAELCTQCFIKNDKITVTGLIFAGLADLKNIISQSDLLDQRLRAKILAIVDISYGGKQGFNEAIELAADTLSNLKFVQEKKIIQKYFTEISTNTEKYCFGINDTFSALESGAVETLIVFENLDANYYIVKDVKTGIESIKILNQKQEKDISNNEIVEKIHLVEWLAQNYKKYGCSLEFVTDKSQEGSQFVNGFGGIGGLLRYKLNFDNFDSDEYFSD